MLKLQMKTWLDDKGVRDAVRQAVAGRGGKPSPLFRAAVDVQVTAQRSMRGGRKQVDDVGDMSAQQRKAGRVRQSKRKRFTRSVPSRPGTPPNVDTGGLKASIRAALDSNKRSAVAGPTVKFGRLHEFGGHIRVTAKMRGYLAWAYGWHLRKDKAVIHMPARPYMRPALDKAKPRLKRYFAKLPLASTPAGRRLNSRKGRPNAT